MKKILKLTLSVIVFIVWPLLWYWVTCQFNMEAAVQLVSALIIAAIAYWIVQTQLDDIAHNHRNDLNKNRSDSRNLFMDKFDRVLSDILVDVEEEILDEKDMDIEDIEDINDRIYNRLMKSTDHLFH